MRRYLRRWALACSAMSSTLCAPRSGAHEGAFGPGRRSLEHAGRTGSRSGRGSGQKRSSCRSSAPAISSPFSTMPIRRSEPCSASARSSRSRAAAAMSAAEIAGGQSDRLRVRLRASDDDEPERRSAPPTGHRGAAPARAGSKPRDHGFEGRWAGLAAHQLLLTGQRHRMASHAQRLRDPRRPPAARANGRRSRAGARAVRAPSSRRPATVCTPSSSKRVVVFGPDRGQSLYGAARAGKLRRPRA